MNSIVLGIGFALAIKHMLADGPLQVPYMYLNKGKFLHPGGLDHAIVHGLLTMGILLVIGHVDARLSGLWWLGFVDMASHYLIDYAKARITESKGWARRTDEGLLITSNDFFIAIVADQAAHFAVYVFILAVVASGAA